MFLHLSNKTTTKTKNLENMTKQVKFIKVDGITVAQLYVNGRLYTEIDLYSGYSKSEAIKDLMLIGTN